MHLVQKSERIMRTDIWREGKWLDLWSVVHVLSGLLVGFFFYYIHIGTTFGLLLAVILLTAYELFEMYVEIYEAPTNRFMDVVVGMIGYVPAFFLISPLLTRNYLVLIFTVVLVVNGVLSINGWRASQKAAILESHVRSRIANKRKRLKERGAKFRSKHHF